MLESTELYKEMTAVRVISRLDHYGVNGAHKSPRKGENIRYEDGTVTS